MHNKMFSFYRVKVVILCTLWKGIKEINFIYKYITNIITNMDMKIDSRYGK